MELLEKLINLSGVSGNEQEVRKFIIKEAKKHVKNVIVDNMGNVIAKKMERNQEFYSLHIWMKLGWW